MAKPASLAATDLSSLKDDELVRLRASLEVEMRTRKIAFTVGTVGEGLVIGHFKATAGLPNLQPAPPGTKNVDALSRNGERYSIKTVWNGKKTGTIYQPEAEKDKQLFEFLLIAVLNPDWSLKAIYQLDWAAFRDVRSWDKRMNAWYVAISQRAFSKATVILAP